MEFFSHSFDVQMYLQNLSDFIRRANINFLYDLCDQVGVYIGVNEKEVEKKEKLYPFV